MTEPIEPITVTMNIDLTTEVGTHYTQVGEDDYRNEPETLGDRVAHLLAEKVYQQAKSSLADTWPATNHRYGDAIDKAIEERVAAELARPVTPTDGYGHPKGEPTTLGEVIDQRIAQWLSQRTGDSFSNNRTTNLQKLINDAVGAALTRDINGAIDAAKLEVTAAVKAQAAQVLAETLTRAAGIR